MGLGDGVAANNNNKGEIRENGAPEKFTVSGNKFRAKLAFHLRLKTEGLGENGVEGLLGDLRLHE